MDGSCFGGLSKTISWWQKSNWFSGSCIFKTPSTFNGMLWVWSVLFSGPYTMEPKNFEIRYCYLKSKWFSWNILLEVIFSRSEKCQHPSSRPGTPWPVGNLSKARHNILPQFLFDYLFLIRAYWNPKNCRSIV